MKNAILIVACLLAAGAPSSVAAQTSVAPKTAEQVKKAVEETTAIKAKIEEARTSARFVRTLTPYPVVLNVDARPFVSVEGPVQLELTFEYYPLKSAGEQKEGARQRPAGINQSQTVILQSGKPLIVSQAADPISDRKVVVEVKATVLK